jgi:periplasmic protein CpxP/Spy
MRHAFMKPALIATFAAGIVFAQAPGTEPRPATPNSEEGRRGFMRGRPDMDRMAEALNLTEAQRAQARTIFQTARQTAQPIREELRQNREKLSAAAKLSNNDAEIQKLATEQGRLMGKMIAIHSQASAKFYQMLTPEQRVKADQMHEEFRQKMRSQHRTPDTEE